MKKLSPRERDERDTRNGIIGVLAFALAIGTILLAVGSIAGWSPSDYTIQLNL